MKKNNFIEFEKEEPLSRLFKRDPFSVLNPLSRISVEDNGEIKVHEYEPGFLEATPKSQDFINKTILKQHDENKKGED